MAITVSYYAPMGISMWEKAVMMPWKADRRRKKKRCIPYCTRFGTGNYQDAKMQKLADKGNGNHAYIDGISEAKKVLVNDSAVHYLLSRKM
jgi:hypothetical protein